MTYRFAVVRVPNTGQRALIAEPNDFESLAEAEARISEIEALQHFVHHTHLEVFWYSGSLYSALSEAGINF